jgi:hypothetical protein
MPAGFLPAFPYEKLKLISALPFDLSTRALWFATLRAELFYA